MVENARRWIFLSSSKLRSNAHSSCLQLPFLTSSGGFPFELYVDSVPVTVTSCSRCRRVTEVLLFLSYEIPSMVEDSKNMQESQSPPCVWTGSRTAGGQSPGREHPPTPCPPPLGPRLSSAQLESKVASDRLPCRDPETTLDSVSEDLGSHSGSAIHQFYDLGLNHLFSMLDLLSEQDELIKLSSVRSGKQHPGLTPLFSKWVSLYQTPQGESRITAALILISKKVPR